MKPLLAISQTMDGRDRWPVVEYILLDAIEQYSGDESYGDVAVFWLDPAATYTSRLQAADYLTVEPSSYVEVGHPLFAIGAPLFAFGFPDNFPATGTSARIDYEARLIYTDLVSVEGTYAGQTSAFGLHAFATDQMGDNPPNGFSGGPITSFTSGQHRLAGMILRGGAGSGLFRFLGTDLITDLLGKLAPQFGKLSRRP